MPYDLMHLISVSLEAESWSLLWVWDYLLRIISEDLDPIRLKSKSYISLRLAALKSINFAEAITYSDSSSNDLK